VNSFLNANAELVITLVKIVLLLFIVLTVNAYLTWFERKVVAHMQSRWGPHRVGRTDCCSASGWREISFKEDPTPAGVDKLVYYLRRYWIGLALTSIALIPFGPEPIRLFGHDIYLGIAPPTQYRDTRALCGDGAGVYGVALAGWASNSKYPLLGGLRSSAQMISYELALTMSVVGVLLMAGSFNLKKLLRRKRTIPSGEFLVGMCGHRFWLLLFSLRRSRKQIACRSICRKRVELVAGFHTEYASFKFAMFFIAEYTSMITVSCLCSILFFGDGCLLPCFVAVHPLLAVRDSDFVWIVGALDGIRYETIFGRIICRLRSGNYGAWGGFCLRPNVNEFIQAVLAAVQDLRFSVCVRVDARELPRFRYDQLMAFGWKLLLSLSIVNVIVTSFVILAKMQWWVRNDGVTCSFLRMAALA